METSVVPSRNPLSYCRLCLSQVNLLTVLDASDAYKTPQRELLQKLNHYARISLNLKEDYPSAVCSECQQQLNDFHEFRRVVTSNNNAVKLFRRKYGDEIATAAPPAMEEGEFYMDVIDDDHEVLQQVYDEPVVALKPGEEIIKEVDVYHLDGELRTVVVKEEETGPIEGIQVVASPPKPLKPAHILNKQASQQAKLPHKKGSPPEKRVKMLSSESAFSLFKCSHCSAVFRNSENLTIHIRDDHPLANKPARQPVPKRAAPQPRQPVKPAAVQQKKTQLPQQQPQQQKVSVLYKCAQCNSSFVHEANFQQHVATCKAAVLAKLNPAQITVKRTVNRATVAPPQQQPTTKTAARNFRCTQCPLTYSSKVALQKHLLDAHKIVNDAQVYFCALCKLNYSCAEDLQLHNRALHPFRCARCNGDYRECMHAQTLETNGVNKVKLI